MSDKLEPPKKPIGPSTLAVHGGEARPKPTHSLTTPIVQTATFTWANSQEVKDHFDGKIDERIDYGRYGNPTQRVAESKLTALEGAGDCLLFASGMAAMTTTLFRSTGMFNCPHTGVALAALRKLVDRKIIRSSERVVVISTANGLKFADQKAAYHMGTLEGIKATHRNKPVELPADPKIGRAHV